MPFWSKSNDVIDSKSVDKITSKRLGMQVKMVPDGSNS
jgi:hypothetical protein